MCWVHSYEAACAAQRRLQEMGIKRLVTPGGVRQAIVQMANDPNIRVVAGAIELELHLTPWNLSQNFLASLTGTGCFSLLKKVIT